MQATIAVPEKPRAGEEQRLNILVVLTVIVALLLGWALKANVESRTSSFTGLSGALSVKYPATWLVGRPENDQTILTVFDPRSPASLHPTFSVTVRPMPKDQRLLDAAMSWTLSRNTDLRAFQDLGTEQTFLDGKMAVRLDYAYIADPPPGSGPATLPIVARGTDILVTQGDQLVVLSGVSDANFYEEYNPRLAEIFKSVRLAGQ
jgi:hypothetical protein